MKIFAILLAVSLVAAPASAQPWWFKVSQAGAITAHAMDLAESERCFGISDERVRQGLPPPCVEKNLLLGRVKSPSGFAFFKMGTVSVEQLALARLAESKPKLATVINIVTTVGFAGIAYHNSRIISQIK